jgi:hypothetical protein
MFTINMLRRNMWVIIDAEGFIVGKTKFRTKRAAIAALRNALFACVNS